MNVSISQAMACGLPVIATRHSGFPEQIQDGITGLLVPENDWQALAGAIVHLIDHPDLWAPMGRAGRARVERIYGGGHLIDKQLLIYEELSS